MARFLSIWSGTPFPIDLVTSESMSPALIEGDIVAWTPSSIDDIEIGDVVVFRSYVHWPDEKIVVHRVTDIVTRKSTGELMLETKGDANTWTDQAGPHIPEPHIREDHLMGKVLSVGKQPLKIPFVGYIGIWVNEGIELLAQSTAAKGALAYAGVFMPLTISAVLLVVLLFTFPEKRKTIKEKLRFYIFGSRPLKVKHTLVFFLTIYLVFLLVIHCFAFDSTTGSLGVERSSPKSSLSFGKINQGETSAVIKLPIINPSTMRVKGIIYGEGKIEPYLNEQIFEIDSGGLMDVSLTATVPNGSTNGSYAGNIMIYSSPFWLLFPDDLMTELASWNGQAAVYILDVFAALVLTFLTLSLLVAITFVSDKYTVMKINRSWCHTSPILLKKQTRNRLYCAKKSIRATLHERMGWVTKVDLATTDRNSTLLNTMKKPIAASLLTIPLLLLLSDHILVMISAALIAGLCAYIISCKVRRKIVLVSLLTTAITISYMALNTQAIILAKDHTVLEIITLSLGAVGVYFLLLAIALIPLALLPWWLVHLIRNVKEDKDPLLILEGSCDL